MTQLEIKREAVRKPFNRRRKACPFSGPNAPKIDYKDTRLLTRYLSEKGKIIPSRITYVSRKKQKELSTAIKRARFLNFCLSPKQASGCPLCLKRRLAPTLFPGFPARRLPGWTGKARSSLPSSREDSASSVPTPSPSRFHSRSPTAPQGHGLDSMFNRKALSRSATASVIWMTGSSQTAWPPSTRTSHRVFQT